MSLSNLLKMPFKPFKLSLLAALFGLGVWFLTRELFDSATRDRTGESAIRTYALVTHLLFATPLLLLPPLQFSRRIRARWPMWHRRVGKLFLFSAITASSLAIYLGWTFESLGRRVPVTLFAVVWLFFSIAAWLTARQRSFKAHERFVVRTYALALAFVFVRVMGEAEASLFFFLPDPVMRGVTREWLCFVLPLLAVEAWYSWWPSLDPKQGRSANPKTV